MTETRKEKKRKEKKRKETEASEFHMIIEITYISPNLQHFIPLHSLKRKEVQIRSTLGEPDTITQKEKGATAINITKPTILT